MGIANLKLQLNLLQTYQMSDFWKTKSSSSQDLKYFIIVVVIIIAIVVIINLLKKNNPSLSGRGATGASSSGGPRQFSGFSLHRIAKNIGLDPEQTKMFDYVLKSDGVTDIEKSINSSSLLDRHFKKAYRSIEQSANTDEEAQQKLAVLFSTRNLLENSSGGNSISSTHQMPENISAILNAGNEKYPVKIVSTKGDSMNVECPDVEDGSGKLSRGSKLSISVFTKGGKGFSFETRLLGISTPHGVTVLQLAHSSQIKHLAQRRFRRRETYVSCNFYFVNVDGKRLVVDKRRLSGNIMDISIGGCAVKTIAPVSSGAKIKIEFVMGDDVQVAALGQVLRTNRTGVNSILNIRFLKVPRKSMNTINAFVYEYAN